MRSVDWRSCSPLSLVLYDKRFMLRPAHKHGNDDVDVKVLCFEKIDRLDPPPPSPHPLTLSRMNSEAGSIIFQQEIKSPIQPGVGIEDSKAF